MNRDTFALERKMQPYMDAVYKSWGFVVDRSVSCKQYDVAINAIGEEKPRTIEEKFNFTPNGHSYDQIIVEIIQDFPSASLGWYFYCEATYLVWVYCPSTYIEPPKTFSFISWKHLKKMVVSKLKQNKWTNVNIVTSGYGITINYPIRFKDMRAAQICKDYNFADFNLSPNGRQNATL